MFQSFPLPHIKTLLVVQKHQVPKERPLLDDSRDVQGEDRMMLAALNPDAPQVPTVLQSPQLGLSWPRLHSTGLLGILSLPP